MQDRAQRARQEGFGEVHHDFERWRERRARGERIPERLWRAAVELAERHGVSRTATTLGLDYYALKRRLESSAEGAGARAAVGRGPSRFVELPLPAATSPPSCVLEIEAYEGRPGLRIELLGLAVADLGALIRSVWSRPS